MILINVRYEVKPEYVDSFREKVAEFTDATRAEEGCIFFDWYRSTDEENVFFLQEAFQEDAAEAHVGSAHFQKAMDDIPPLLLKTPDIINTTIPGKTTWDKMAEFQVD